MTTPEQYNLIKSKLIQAFGDVKLGDGVGFFEAQAIDEEKDVNAPFCKSERALDEREDWQKVLKMIEDNDHNYDFLTPCFMDDKGKIFFLPIQLLVAIYKNDDTTLSIKFSPQEEDTSYESFNWLKQLSVEQKNCVIEIFELLLQYRMEHCLQCTDWKCCYCTEIHSREAMTNEEMLEDYLVEDLTEILRFLKSYLN
jgi:hypothetical protein